MSGNVSDDQKKQVVDRIEKAICVAQYTRSEWPFSSEIEELLWLDSDIIDMLCRNAIFEFSKLEIIVIFLEGDVRIVVYISNNVIDKPDRVNLLGELLALKPDLVRLLETRSTKNDEQAFHFRTYVTMKKNEIEEYYFSPCITATKDTEEKKKIPISKFE